VNASEIETGTETGREKENLENGNGKEAAPLWPFRQVLFSRMSANVIVWKARSIVTATANVTVEDLAHIILHSPPLRPSLSQHVTHVHAYL
jgi:hypothetical protein